MLQDLESIAAIFHTLKDLPPSSTKVVIQSLSPYALPNPVEITIKQSFLHNIFLEQLMKRVDGVKS